MADGLEQLSSMFDKDLQEAIKVFKDDLRKIGASEALITYTYEFPDGYKEELDQLSSIRHKEVFVNQHGAFYERVGNDQYVAIDLDELDRIIQAELNIAAKDMLARCRAALGNL